MEKALNSINYTNFLIWLTCFFIALWVLLFAFDKSPLLLKYQTFGISYKFSLSGIFGLLAAFTYGWYLSKKFLKPDIEITSLKHASASLYMVVYTLLLYLIGFTLFTFAFPSYSLNIFNSVVFYFIFIQILTKKKYSTTCKYNYIFIVLKKQYWLLFFLLLFYLGLAMFDQAYIFTDAFLYESLREEFSENVIESLLASGNRFGWVAYAILPIVILFKVLFATVCITIGVILADIDFTFKKIFKSAITSEYVFLTSQTLFSFSLFMNRADLTIENAGNYFPFSMLSFFGVDNVVSWLHYPLQTLNRFEVVYVVLISWLLSRQWKPDFIESLNIVIPSYGIGLLVWMILVVFLTLQIS